jgi:hypothetical protein
MGPVAAVVSKILWVVCGLAACAAALIFLLSNPTSAEQQAAGAASACAIVIIPYVLARAWYHLFKEVMARANDAKTTAERAEDKSFGLGKTAAPGPLTIPTQKPTIEEDFENR